MKADKKYLYALLGILAVYIFLELRKPEELDWTETYHFRDKIPFGTKVTHDLLQDIVGGEEAEHAFRSLYELIETEQTEGNLLMLSSVAMPGKQETDALLEHVLMGNTVLIAAENLGGYLADSLDFSMQFDEQLLRADMSDVQAALAGESYTEVEFTNAGFPNGAFRFPSVAVSTYFTRLDNEKYEVLAENDEGRPVLVRYKGISGGKLFLSSMPLALTNYFVLSEETSNFAEALLSLFPEDERLTHNEYYQMGRMESRSLIRFLLRHEALRWAYFLLIGTVIFFILFEIKRRQRIIPVVIPPRNKTLEFVQTLGRLHYRQSNHTNLAKKRIQYWLEYVRSHYNMSTNQLDEPFVDELSKKSGKDKVWLKELVSFAERANNGNHISEDELIASERLLIKFYGIEKSK